MAFSENLKRLMEEKSITDYRLAKELKVHATTIKNWKSGIAPRLEHIQAISQYFDISIDDLMKRGGKK